MHTRRYATFSAVRATTLAAIAATLGASRFVSAQSAQGVRPAQLTPCAQDPKFREFDFWVGEWDVTPVNIPAGRPKPQSSIEKILADCVILENWKPAAGPGGKSFNIYNRARQQWEQTWVDASGLVVYFTGHVRDGNMYYTSSTPLPNGGTQLGKMTFFRVSADSVRQLWEQSNDNGKTWTTGFDGMYVRKRAGSLN